jgi:eukaryotic-like serine/threonine-protein kinase
MSVVPGTRFGPYVILGPLGAGGMGEVYRARDSRLDRTVAFKIISPRLARESGHQRRFEREARVISSLNHPHICALYDVGEQDDIAFLVMEYLEGETLAQRLVRGPLAIDAALRIAIEIATALDHAHRSSVTHRDLKPSNVMLTPVGTKLLDFGLAKLDTPHEATQSLPDAAVTAEGTILGTFQYMAPEQFEGHEADPRTDIFAFGAVVYEMITGRKAFEGRNQASLIAAILHADPAPMSAVTPVTPDALDHVIARCLAKNREERWQTARDVMLELRAIERRSGVTSRASSGVSVGSNAEVGLPARAQVPEHRWRRVIQIALIVGILAIGAAALLMWRSVRERDATASAPTTAIQSEIPAPANTAVDAMALSPDGRRLVFVGRTGAKTELWIRQLSDVTPQPLADTEGAAYPFWSPDGTSIGFFADGKLKRIEAAGGPSQTVADAPASRGGTWSRRGVIVFAASIWSLREVSERGGPAEPVTMLDATRGEISHRWPQFLPDGEHFIYLVQSSQPENRGLFIGSLTDRSMKQFLVRTDFSGLYAAPGYLLFLRDKMLMAHRFRTERLTLEDAPALVVGPIAVDGLEHAHVDASETGRLVYRRGGFLGGAQLAWFGRNQQRLGTVGAPGDYRGLRLSPNGPNGLQVAVTTEDPSVMTPDISFVDVAHGNPRRFTFGPGTNNDPVWSPDGHSMAFRSIRGEGLGVYVRPVAGGGEESQLIASTPDKNVHVYDWFKDGRVLFSQVDPEGKTDRDIWTVSTQGDRKPRRLVHELFAQDFPRFSPNGRWIAYQTKEPSGTKIIVVSSTDARQKFEVPALNSLQPVWNPNGKELFYLSASNTITSVDVTERGDSLSFGTARPVFTAPLAAVPESAWTYDVADLGRRFLVILAVDNPAPVTVVSDWWAQLKK